MSKLVKQIQIVEEDYEPLALLSDIDTIEGIASYFKLYSNITGNKKIRVFVDQQKYRPSKKHILSKDTRKVPNAIESSMKYFVVTRSSKSYNIYTFDNINFLNGVYIGIGLCREDYKYIIRGFGETTVTVEKSSSDKKNSDEKKSNKDKDRSTKADGLLLTPENKQEYNKAVGTLVEYVMTAPPASVDPAEPEPESPKVVHKSASTTETKDSDEESGIIETSKLKTYGTDGTDETVVEIEPIIDIEPLTDDFAGSSSPKKAKIIRKSPIARRNSNTRRLSPRNISTVSPVFESMKLDELKKYADKNKINIKGLSKKSEIVHKLNNYK